MMDEYRIVKRGEKTGMADAEGRIIIYPVWDGIRDLQEGYAVVKLGGRFGAVDAQGRVIAAPEWDEVQDCSEGLFIAKKDGAFFILPADGGAPVSVGWDECRCVYSFYDGVAVFMDDYSCKYGCFDREGRLMVGAFYDSPSQVRAAAKEEE